MKINRFNVFVTLVLVVAAALSVAAISAQQSTEEPTAESTAMSSSFTDGRINGDIFLGGLAVYCLDENGSSTAGNTFGNGSITVWGPDGQQYITLTAAQLRGTTEVPQPVMEMTVEPSATLEMMPTDDMAATVEPLAAPVLLAQANTPYGPVAFYRTGDDEFAIQAYDNVGKFFTYTWADCGLGSVSTDTAPYGMVTLPTVTVDMSMATETPDASMATAMPETTETPEPEMTAEATASS